MLRIERTRLRNAARKADRDARRVNCARIWCAKPAYLIEGEEKAFCTNCGADEARPHLRENWKDCRVCGDHKQLIDFTVRHDAPDGRCTSCRQCSAAENKKQVERRAARAVKAAEAKAARRRGPETPGPGARSWVRTQQPCPYREPHLRARRLG